MPDSTLCDGAPACTQTEYSRRGRRVTITYTKHRMAAGARGWAMTPQVPNVVTSERWWTHVILPSRWAARSVIRAQLLP